jgi:hypothetical protein
VAVRIVRLFWKPVVVHYLATYESFERKGGEHIKAKTQSGNLHHYMTLRGEIVEDVALGEGSESEEARERHCEAGYQRDKGAVVRYGREAVDCRRPKRAINQEGVMVAHKCCGHEKSQSKGKDGDGLEVVPKEMTPTAWKKPLLTKSSPLRSPLRSLGTVAPCVMTVIIITNMLINANVDAFASCHKVVSNSVALFQRPLSDGSNPHLCNVPIKT